MAAPGALAVGRPANPTTGSAQVVMARSGQLLGFFVNPAAGGTVVLYDAATTTGLPTAILNSGTLVGGWYAFPLDLLNGLVANCSAATTFVVL